MPDPSTRWDTLRLGSQSIEGTIQERDKRYYERYHARSERSGDSGMFKGERAGNADVVKGVEKQRPMQEMRRQGNMQSVL